MRSKLLRTAAMGIFMFAASLGIKAQNIPCPINLENQTPCDVILTITFEEMNPNCVTCSGSPITIVVPPTGVIRQITCSDIASSCSNPVCGASLTLGTSGSLSPTPLIWNPGGVMGTVAGSSCINNFFIDWSPTGDHIVIHP